MNKIIHKQALSILFFIATSTIALTGYADSSSEILEDIKTYLFNLGGDFGYTITDPVSTPTNTLLVSSNTATNGSVDLLQLIETHALVTFFGAIPVNASLLDPTLLNFIPADNTIYKILNTFANATFLSYNTAQSSTGTLSVTPLMDQQPYQMDPVSQSILNILGTPDDSYCTSSSNEKCSLLAQTAVISNVVGPVPATPYLGKDGSQQILAELNSNSLTAPLLYSTTKSSDSNTRAPASSGGLTASTQAELAANFVRYASGTVIPIDSMTQTDYMALLGKAGDTTSDSAKRQEAMSSLTKYLAQIRVYAAQSSVGISNLYYILSKRLPQSQADLKGSSQAMAEMEMATRRLSNPAAVAAEKPQWLAQINTASPATVQKEMAILLAEINYQLYLNRQQDERLLLTNSLLLLHDLIQNPPQITPPDDNPDTSPEAAAAQDAAEAAESGDN